jgi:phage terminase large subunit-like protein
MRTSGENKINYKDVTKWFVEVQNELDIYIYKIGYDDWQSQYIVDELKALFGKNSTERVIQGKKTMSSPMKSFESDLKAKKINYNNNSILKWNLANAAIDIDKNDNISLIKTSKSRKRIDGVASAIDAFTVYERNYEEYMSMI